jgi:hypothetical protein
MPKLHLSYNELLDRHAQLQQLIRLLKSDNFSLEIFDKSPVGQVL